MLRDVDLLDRTPDTHNRPAPTPSRQLVGTSAAAVAKVAAGAAAGAAAGGGIPGAVAGAAKSAGTILVRAPAPVDGSRPSPSPRSPCSPVLAVAAATGGGSLAGLQAEQGSGDARAVTAATQAGIPTGTLTRLREATLNTGVQWQVIAAIYHTQQAQTGGTGPFHIDTAAGQVPAATASDAASSAALLANRLQALLRQQPGYTDRADIAAGSVVHDNGTISWPPQRHATHLTLAAQYVAALRQLPLVVAGGLTDAWARGIFDTATQWRVGQAASQGGQTGVTVCAPVGDGPLTLAQTDGTPVTVSPTQLGHAATIVHVGTQLGVTDPGLVVAIMVGLQESGLHTYANINVPQSLLFPHHETVGNDKGLTSNVFQQQPWWGPDAASLMDETFAAKAFFGRPDRVHPPPGRAAGRRRHLPDPRPVGPSRRRSPPTRTRTTSGSPSRQPSSAKSKESRAPAAGSPAAGRSSRTARGRR